jgi:hypothetical protein
LDGKIEMGDLFFLFAPKFNNMIVKIFKLIWLISLLVMLGVFVYCYASWPQMVSLSETEESQSVDKSVLFYVCLGLAGAFNAMVFVVTRFQFSHAFVCWFYGLVISFHVFFVSGFIFITIFNSNEKYDYSMVGPMVYGGIVLLLIWSASWPIYLLANKFIPQRYVGQ